MSNVSATNNVNPQNADPRARAINLLLETSAGFRAWELEILAGNSSPLQALDTHMRGAQSYVALNRPAAETPLLPEPNTRATFLQQAEAVYLEGRRQRPDTPPSFEDTARLIEEAGRYVLLELELGGPSLHERIETALLNWNEIRPLVDGQPELEQALTGIFGGLIGGQEGQHFGNQAARYVGPGNAISERAANNVARTIEMWLRRDTLSAGPVQRLRPVDPGTDRETTLARRLDEGMPEILGRGASGRDRELAAARSARLDEELAAATDLMTEVFDDQAERAAALDAAEREISDRHAESFASLFNLRDLLEARLAGDAPRAPGTMLWGDSECRGKPDFTTVLMLADSQLQDALDRNNELIEIGYADQNIELAAAREAAAAEWVVARSFILGTEVPFEPITVRRRGAAIAAAAAAAVTTAGIVVATLPGSRGPAPAGKHHSTSGPKRAGTPRDCKLDIDIVDVYINAEGGIETFAQHLWEEAPRNADGRREVTMSQTRQLVKLLQTDPIAAEKWAIKYLFAQDVKDNVNRTETTDRFVEFAGALDSARDLGIKWTKDGVTYSLKHPSPAAEKNAAEMASYPGWIGTIPGTETTAEQAAFLKAQRDTYSGVGNTNTGWGLTDALWPVIDRARAANPTTGKALNPSPCQAPVSLVP